MLSFSEAQTEPTRHVRDANRAVRSALPFDDTRDFAAADRGFIAGPADDIVRSADGTTVWDNGSFSFLHGECPPTVNPSLWRQSQLNMRQGLYFVADGVYQLRGFDLSVMTVIEGDIGIVVVDPLNSTETAAAALALYRHHRGDRVVTGLIYTHSHIDHFGGTFGVTTAEDVQSGHCRVVAPVGFAEHAVSENVYAGAAMARRAQYMYGASLPRGPKSSVGAGLGQAVSTGVKGFVQPTTDITVTGQRETIDGVEFEFQVTPGTEAPAEMNFYLPAVRALCIAENATHNLHNVLTLRGALVRDARVWSRYLTESITLFGQRSDVLFASHHWPTWGRGQIVEFLSLQRDLYGYLHDQTLRMISHGMVAAEIAEAIELPPALQTWANRGYYGSVNHNVKAIYQRYMGWFDGNPAHLWEHPQEESAKRHVRAMGGAASALRTAKSAYDEGDYRWASQVANYVIFAEPSNESARRLQAASFEQLAYSTENATWRNFYLSGAYELRHGTFAAPASLQSAAMLSALTVEQTFDAVAVRLDGKRAWNTHVTSDWMITDAPEQSERVELRNGTLVHYRRAGVGGLLAPDATIALTRTALGALLLGGADPAGLRKRGALTVTGDWAALKKLTEVLDRSVPDFAIVTP
ncbi:alkyl/aryl-sulfatase [Gordonia malaquae]|uniref:alkyl/aryl-sulfatase n=1 Tax=Gordonia malaquae TaxID=410332 RepID=UPI0030FE75D7